MVSGPRTRVSGRARPRREAVLRPRGSPVRRYRRVPRRRDGALRLHAETPRLRGDQRRFCVAVPVATAEVVPSLLLRPHPATGVQPRRRPDHHLAILRGDRLGLAAGGGLSSGPPRARADRGPRARHRILLRDPEAGPRRRQSGAGRRGPRSRPRQSGAGRRGPRSRRRQSGAGRRGPRSRPRRSRARRRGPTSGPRQPRVGRRGPRSRPRWPRARRRGPTSRPRQPRVGRRGPRSRCRQPRARRREPTSGPRQPRA